MSYIGIVLSKHRGRTRASMYNDIDFAKIHIFEDAYEEKEVQFNGHNFEVGSIVLVDIRRPSKVIKVISNPTL